MQQDLGIDCLVKLGVSTASGGTERGEGVGLCGVVVLGA